MDLVLIILVLFLLFGRVAIGDIDVGDNSELYFLSLRRTKSSTAE